MKKLLTIALCAAAVSALADPTEVELGEVGVTEIRSALSNTIVAVSYDDLAGGTGMVCSNLVKTTNLTKGDMLVEFRDNKYTGWVLAEDTGMVCSNLVKTTNLTKGDMLVEFRDNKYTGWVLAEDTETQVKYWQERLETFVDNAGNQLSFVGSSADTITNAVGTGIWLVRQNPIAANGSTNSFYIYGKPVADPISNIASNKWTLIGNPKQELVEIGTNKVIGASYLDELVVPVEPDGKLCRYQFKDGKGWRTTGSDGKWVDNAPPKLGAGLGCWILTQKDASITW